MGRDQAAIAGDFGSKAGAGSTARFADRCRLMTDPTQKKAAHYRDIARLITDEQTKEGLLALAAEYEAFAERRAGDAPPETQE